MQPIGHEQINGPLTEARAALASHAGARSASVMTGIHRDDYFDSIFHERFGRACDRPSPIQGRGDRTRLTAPHITLRSSSSLPWFRVGRRRVDIGRTSCSAPKLLCCRYIHELSGDGRLTERSHARQTTASRAPVASRFVNLSSGNSRLLWPRNSSSRRSLRRSLSRRLAAVRWAIMCGATMRAKRRQRKRMRRASLFDRAARMIDPKNRPALMNAGIKAGLRSGPNHSSRRTARPGCLKRK